MRNSSVALITRDFILDPWLDQIADRLSERGYEIMRGPHQRPPAKTIFEPDQISELFGRADLVVATTRSIISRDVLSSPRLRAVVFPTIGTESVDLSIADELGIMVAHGPTPENFNSMSEATVLLMLMLSYDMHGTEAVLRENMPRPARVKATMLMGKTIGLLGLGRIGRGVVDRLQNWGVDFLVHDPHVDQAALPGNVRAVDLETLMSESDIVSIHAILTPETRHIVNAGLLARMKPTAWLINTARGGIVDEDALIDVLQRGRIAGAALDTFVVEPLPKDSALRTLDNVILTPHMVGHTRDLKIGRAHV